MKKAVIFGAGSIGRGYMGHLLTQSGYHVVFIDINESLVRLLNQKNGYPIRIIKNEIPYEIEIQNVSAVSANETDLVAETIASAEVMATAVGVRMLDKASVQIAAGLRRRMALSARPLNIIVCENKLNANRYLENLVREQLNATETEYLDKSVGFVETSVTRCVPATTPEMQEGNPLRIWAEEYDTLPLDKASVKAQMPPINHMKLIDPFDHYLKRKLFIHNMAHATVAYLGVHDGQQYFVDAWARPAIKLITYRAMIESSMAFSAETELPYQELIDLADNISYRFSNKKLIMILDRICADPIRKLSENERLIGPSILCEKHSLQPVYLGIGIAAALLYRNTNDVSAAQLQKQIEADGVSTVIRALSDGKLSERFIRAVEVFYNMLKQKADWIYIIEKAEQMKNEGIVVY